RARGRGFSFSADDCQHGSDLDRFTLVMPYFKKYTCSGARHLSIDLIGRDLEDGFVLVDLVTDILQPFRDSSLGDRFAHLRHYDFYAHKLSGYKIKIRKT